MRPWRRAVLAALTIGACGVAVGRRKLQDVRAARRAPRGVRLVLLSAPRSGSTLLVDANVAPMAFAGGAPATDFLPGSPPAALPAMEAPRPRASEAAAPWPRLTPEVPREALPLLVAEDGRASVPSEAPAGSRRVVQWEFRDMRMTLESNAVLLD